MTIETMEALEEVEVGQTVRLSGGILWERVDKGWRQGDTVLESAYFSGALRANDVRLVVRVEPGMCFTDGTRFWVVTAVGDARAQATSVLGGQAMPLSPTVEALQEMQRVAPPPDVLLVLAARVRELAAEVNRLGEVTLPERFIEQVRAVAADLDDDDLDELLDNWQIGREREHVSDVTITGKSYLVPSRSVLESMLGDGFQIDSIDDSATVEWHREVQVTLTGQGCMCEAVDRESLEDHLPDDYEEWDFEASCA